VASLVTQQVERTVNQARDAHKSDLALLAGMADAASHAAQESKTQAAKQSENDNIQIKALERKMARMSEFLIKLNIERCLVVVVYRALKICSTKHDPVN
jgi:hypothetical protein